jgi:hypothetical protein
LLIEDRQGVEGVGTTADQLEVGALLDIRGEQLARQEFVVDDKDFIFHIGRV